MLNCWKSHVAARPSIYNWEETGGEGKLLKSFCLSISDLAWLVSKIFFAKYLHRKKYIYRIMNSCCKIPNLNYLKKNKLFKAPEEKHANSTIQLISVLVFCHGFLMCTTPLHIQLSFMKIHLFLTKLRMALLASD